MLRSVFFHRSIGKSRRSPLPNSFSSSALAAVVNSRRNQLGLSSPVRRPPFLSLSSSSSSSTLTPQPIEGESNCAAAILNSRRDLYNRMESTSTVAARRKGKGKTDGSRSRRLWTKREEDFLVSAMRELVTDPKWKCDTGAFRNGFYAEVEKKIIMAFTGTDLRASPHIESKIKSWKKIYHVLHDMMRTSGFGWDDVTKMVLVDSDEVWQEYIKKNPEAANMKDKQFPYYEDWLVLFGNDRATGAEAVDPFLAEESMNAEEYETMNLDGNSFDSFTLPTDMDDQPSPVTSTPTTSKGGRKRGRASDGMAKSISEMVDTFGSFFEKTDVRLGEIAKGINYQQEGREARKKLNEELLRLPLDPKDRMKVLLAISKSDTLVDIFFSLDTEEDRMNFIQQMSL